MSIPVLKYHIQKKHIAALLLGVSAAAGIVQFILFIIPRSKPDDQLLFGLSAARVLLGSVFLVLLLLNIGALLLILMRSVAWRDKLIRQAKEFFVRHQVLIMVGLYVTLLGVGAFLAFMLPPIFRPLQFLIPWHIRLGGFLTWILTASLCVTLTLRVVMSETIRADRHMARLDTLFVCVLIVLGTFFLYFRTAVLIGWINKTVYSFWDVLAGQFVQGKLYLENPQNTHDLTPYKGRWYVPMPPLPAILLMPCAYWFGVESISTSYFSMFASGLNGVLLFLILKQLVALKWIDLSGYGIFWVIVVFLFGTPQFWLGINGRGWYVSQILTLLFLALAVYGALRSWSVWWIAACLGAAMLARPNSLMTWPLVFAISMQLLRERQGELAWKQALQWAVKSMFPIGAAVIILLSYNYLRFESFTDFGYTSLDGDPEIVQNAQTYGLFSPRFIPNNLYIMLLKTPRINWGTPWPVEPKGAMWPIDPTTTGMSIFLATPPLLYLWRRYPKQWWVLGAWGAVLCNVVMLSMYSNAGAHQFGYRYILDFLVPLMILLAVGLGKKIPWHFVLLTLFSIIINLYGAYWFMNG